MCRIVQRPVKRMFLTNPRFWSPTWRIKRHLDRRSRTQTLRSTQRQKTTVWRFCTFEHLAHSLPLLEKLVHCTLRDTRGSHRSGHEGTRTEIELILSFRCYFLFVCLFVRSVPVSCWLTIMNRCALDLGSFQLLPFVLLLHKI